ncbi:unnamed protein product [Vitrella brassicaformis CCMP3155]|uniref:EF-hand domain-containing protein n=1 Tax=Vitrella brassicaformis (strain CCMP3155) TaxID=1169540 RepID=A0A0G4FEE4_VITBC|nr:unnamed protein product [Vitrella brassicaformis CCMP3155]|eukprot:CEM11565.1 unnamed protein product [Vitrella brassicaformis CCMP3155]
MAEAKLSEKLSSEGFDIDTPKNVEEQLVRQWTPQKLTPVLLRGLAAKMESMKTNERIRWYERNVLFPILCCWAVVTWTSLGFLLFQLARAGTECSKVSGYEHCILKTYPPFGPRRSQVNKNKRGVPLPCNCRYYSGDRREQLISNEAFARGFETYTTIQGADLTFEGAPALVNALQTGDVENVDRIPPSIGNQRFMVFLVLTWSQLTSIPKEVCLLSNLVYLAVDWSNLDGTTFPDCLWLMPRLEKADFSYGNIAALPSSLAGSTSFKHFSLRGNPICHNGWMDAVSGAVAEFFDRLISPPCRSTSSVGEELTGTECTPACRVVIDWFDALDQDQNGILCWDEVGLILQRTSLTYKRFLKLLKTHQPWTAPYYECANFNTIGIWMTGGESNCQQCPYVLLPLLPVPLG